MHMLNISFTLCVLTQGRPHLMYTGALWKMSVHHSTILHEFHKVYWQISPISQDLTNEGHISLCHSQASPLRQFQEQEKYITHLLIKARVPNAKEVGFPVHLLACDTEITMLSLWKLNFISLSQQEKIWHLGDISVEQHD